MRNTGPGDEFRSQYSTRMQRCMKITLQLLRYRYREHETYRTRTMRHKIATFQRSNTRAHACSVLALFSFAIAVSRGTGALALQRGGVHVMRNLRARLPNQRQSKWQAIGRIDAAQQQAAKRQKCREGEGHAEHPALVDVGCKGEQAAQSQQPGEWYA
jgi:hypothetical protein